MYVRATMCVCTVQSWMLSYNNLVWHYHAREQHSEWIAEVKLKLKTNLLLPYPLTLQTATAQSIDIEVPGYLPGFRSRDCAEILSVTMLCYA